MTAAISSALTPWEVKMQAAGMFRWPAAGSSGARRA
jgi:hypothetical protein